MDALNHKPTPSPHYVGRDVALKGLKVSITNALSLLDNQHDLYLSSLPAAAFFPHRRFIPPGVVYDLEIVPRNVYNDHEIESHVAVTPLEICRELQEILLTAYQQLSSHERITKIEFLLQQTTCLYQIYKRVTFTDQPILSQGKNS